MLPKIEEVKEIINNICSYTDVLNKKMGLPVGISRKHYENVAYCASKIASCCGLNKEKAYILGILHDYGEYIEDTIPNTFHGTVGYDEMMLMGYDEVARTCLTHSFWEGIYKVEHFKSYNSNEIKRAIDIISTMTLDKYDYLIQLSDMLCSNKGIVTVEERIDYIVNKYNLDRNLVCFKYNKANELKEYFDKLCNQNIYDILGVK